MGDGPGYDYAARKAVEAADYKFSRQVRRRELLHVMMRDVGFGDNDGNLSAAERHVVDCLTMADEILGLLTRARSHRGT